jgi:tetratricopeptide (TPR) repeat protein
MNSKIITLIQSGQFKQALIEFDLALKKTPHDAQLWSNRGVVLIQLGQLTQARESIYTSLNIQHDDQVEQNLINLLIQLNQFKEASEHNNRQLKKNNNSAQLQLNKAKIAAGLNNWDESFEIYSQIINKYPQYLPAYVAYAYELNKQEKYEEAIAINLKALKVDSNCYPAILNLGIAYNNNKEYENALLYLKKYVNVHQPDMKTWLTIITAQLKTHGWLGARESIILAQEIDPNNILLKFQNGALYLIERKFEQAINELREVIAMDKDHVEAHYHLALALLAQKQFTNVDHEFRYRIKSEKIKYGRFDDFIATGINEKTELLIGKEQGIGDEILLSRLIPSLKKQVKSITYVCDDRLINILKRSLNGIDIVGESEYLENEHHYDQCLKINLGTIFRYLHNPFKEINKLEAFKVKKEIYESMKIRYPKKNKKIIGLSWKSKNLDIGKGKSMQLADLEELLKDKKYEFMNLQYGDVDNEIRQLDQKGITVYDDKSIDKFNDLESLFAITSLCDMVITTSNVTAHIAGALKIKVFLLLPKFRGRLWYWEDQNISSWYPSIEIIEQEIDGSWEMAINKLEAKVKNYS